MRYAITFMTWATLMMLFLIVGALLIPYEHQVAYNRAPKDVYAYASNAFWWAVPLSWFLAPAQVAGWARVVGALLFILGAALLIWARRVNPFFLPVIREPRWIVTEGPYRLMAHPGYFGFVVMADATWLMLGHWTAAVPLGGFIGLLIARAQRENRILNLIKPAGEYQ
jgi:protein-S-isoprenylcysteine O-methyltransferase Ste14